MVIVWKGAGILVAVLGAGSLIGTQALVNAVAGDAHYYTDHQWPKLLAGTVGAGLLWFIGRRLNGPFDAEHTFFWIPMEYWGAALLVFSVFAALLTG